MDNEVRFWSDDRGSIPAFGIYFSSVIWLLYSFFVNLYPIPSIYHYYYQFLIIIISKKIFACRFEYTMKQETIKNASRYLKNANVLANDFKQFLASCHVQQVNNLYVFIIMIFIDSDSYRYLEILYN